MHHKVICILIFLFIPFSAGAAEECPQGFVKAVSVQGKVDIQRPGTYEWISINNDHSICFGDKIRTAKQSRTTLKFNNGPRITLDQNSTMVLVTPPEKRRSWIINLINGSTFTRSRQPHRLNIQTPFINAVHEGTEFLVVVNALQTAITVFDGRVAAKNQLGEITIDKGYTGIAEKNQPPRVQALTIQPEDAVQWALYYPPIIDYSKHGPSDDASLQSQINAALQNNPYQALTLMDAIPASQQKLKYLTLKSSLLLMFGRVDEATTLLDQALVLDSGNSTAIALQSIIAVTKNRQDKAMTLAQQAVASDPKSAVAQIALSYAYQANFDIESALTATKEAVRLSPDNALAWARLSELQLSKGERNDAQESAQKSETLNPKLGRTQTILGFASLAQVDIDEAKAAFSEAIKLDSADPLARLGLGLSKIRKGDIEEGTSDIETAVSLDPDNAIMRSYLGKAYYELKNDEYAATELAIAKEADPKDPTPWFYDAIRKQTANRPVEALHDMQTAIELNDNRGVYRSKLLLDEDLAGRAVSLARIFENLGFDQPAVNQSSNSLDLDPSNYSAHRFLSDTYSQRSRHEVSRVSELLQSQLDQPININPIQPETSEAKLNILTDTSPSNASFNEFTPLFESNEVQFLASGIVGNNNTISDQAVISGVFNNLSYSLGQFHYASDGFRENNEIRHNIYNAYIQGKLTNSINLQFEYRNRKTEEGDLRLRINPADFSKIFDREIHREVYRAGANVSLNSNSRIIFSSLYIERDDNTKSLAPQGRLPSPPLRLVNESRRGYDIQAQYLFRHDLYNFMIGSGGYSFEGDHQRTFLRTDVNQLLFDASKDISGDWQEVYFYSNIFWPRNITWTFGLSYEAMTDAFEQGLDRTSINPKFGLKWNPTKWATLRFAAFQSNKRSLVFEQSLQPTQIAGFSQQLDDFNGTRVRRYGIGIDLTPTKDFFMGFEISRRELTVPFTFTRLIRSPQNIQTQLKFEGQHENLFRSYLNWTLYKNWGLSTEFKYLSIKRGSETHQFPNSQIINRSLVSSPTELRNMIIPIEVHYFDPSGLFGSLTGTYVDQKLTFLSSFDPIKHNNDFFLIDLSVGYRLPKKLGVMNFQIKNLLDENFNYQDTNIQSSEPTQPMFIPDRTFIGQITISY